jgi:signal transduction histidine kinase
VRRRLSLLVAATTSAVVLAFVIPLGLLVRTLAEDRAIRTTTVQAQCIAGVATSVTDPVRRDASFRDCSADRPGTAPQPTVVFPDGSILGPLPPANDPGLVAARVDGTAQTVRTRTHAVVYVVTISGRGTLVVRAVIPVAELRVGVVRAWVTLGVLAFLLLVAAVLAAGRLAARVSRPLLQVAAAAQAMRAGRLDTRVAEKGPPEVVALAGALNGLAERVQQLLAAERDAVADLSHRLRTPVTALRLDSESVDDPEVADRLRTHVSALERTVDAIVHDTRRPTRTQPGASCDVGRVVAERVQFWSALADDQGRALQLFAPERPLRARLDASDLADIVDVLVDNVFAHTDEGVALTVWVVARGDGDVVLSVEDGGGGMPSGDVVARGRSGAGSSGLGLDIVRRLAIASGGSLELGTSQLGGALVRVVLGGAA